MALFLMSPARFSERFGRRFGDPAHLHLHQVAEDRAAAGEEGWVCGSRLQPCHPRVPLSVPISAPGWWQRQRRARCSVPGSSAPSSPSCAFICSGAGVTEETLLMMMMIMVAGEIGGRLIPELSNRI